jgi:homoserine dehydrogenase
MSKKITLGLFGFGCVGQGLYHVLHETNGLKAEIKKIVVKNRDKQRSIDNQFFFFDRNEIILDPEIDVVVELIDDASAAFEILKLALQNGKHVVTANKKMIAENLEEIYNLQVQHNRSVLYEGAVCGSIPILRNLEEYYDNDLIKSIEGIFNGSTNYILTKIFEEKVSYENALIQAQKLGFAESDPSLDVQAYDPAFKLAITLAHAFGVFIKPENIIRLGIDTLSSLDLIFAKEKGYTIKLVARACKHGEAVYGIVAPQFVTSDNVLASVRHEFNAVSVEGAFSEKQLFVGKGAGSRPTASAVLSDISALSYGYRYEYKKKVQQPSSGFSNEASLEVFVRFNHGEKISFHDFEEFQSGYAAGGQHYMLGKASLRQINSWSKNKSVSVILSPGATFLSYQADKQASVELVA